MLSAKHNGSYSINTAISSTITAEHICLGYTKKVEVASVHERAREDCGERHDKFRPENYEKMPEYVLLQ
eukprot:scaffold1638_cov112-Skeletonema_dohrnii-CCMP3373.AAC.4